ncbi:MAG TPA: hypothetical protein VFK62_11000 [Gaiellaceae bacterium]|nr:hypothetical protein [Gaiellaceae bacterium]
MQLLVIDSLLAFVLVAAVVLGCRGMLAGASTRRRRAVGWLLIALPLPLAVGVETFASPPRVLADAGFVAGVAAFALGALLVLSRDDGDGREGDVDPESPPWWPDFEREFRSYARRSSRPRVLR